ncbi:antibiotic biosynthesis monooxygenase family protein [Ekhidna sp.]
MIARIWHGWTLPRDADDYEMLIKVEVFEKVEKKKIPGYRGAQLLRHDHADEVEFVSIIWFEKLENVASFVGDDLEKAHVPDRCKSKLLRFDTQVKHFEMKYETKK